MSRNLRNHPSIAAATLLGVAALTTGCEEAPAFQAPPPPTVTVQNPSLEEVTTYDEFTGRLQAMATVEVRARVQGYLRSVEFEAGENVAVGDLLFTIEPEPFEAKLSAAQAALAQAVAARDLANVRLDRTQRAFDQGAANDLELIERKAELDAGEAAVLAAQAEVDAAQIDLDYTEVHSPLAGRVSREMVDVGNLVGGSEPTLLTTIVRDDPMYAYVDVSERDLLEFVEGGRPERREEADRLELILVTADGKRHAETGEFNFAETRVDTSTGTLQIRAAFPNGDGSLYPGLFVRVLVPNETGQQTLVPDTSIQRDLAGEYVLVVAEANKVERRPVEIGSVVGTNRIVTAGLSPDDRVIVNGIQRAFPGATVAPEEAAPAPAPAPASAPAPEPETTDAAAPAGEG